MSKYNYCKVVYKPEEWRGIAFYKHNGTPFTVKYDDIEQAERDFNKILGSGTVTLTSKNT